MSEPASVPADDAVAHAVGTAGLILNVVAVIAFALCLAGLGLGRPPLAMTAAIVALVSFAASLACVIADGKRFADSDDAAPQSGN